MPCMSPNWWKTPTSEEQQGIVHGRECRKLWKILERKNVKPVELRRKRRTGSHNTTRLAESINSNISINYQLSVSECENRRHYNVSKSSLHQIYRMKSNMEPERIYIEITKPGEYYRISEIQWNIHNVSRYYYMGIRQWNNMGKIKLAWLYSNP